MSSVLRRTLICGKAHLISKALCGPSNLRFRYKHTRSIRRLKMNEAYVEYDNDSEAFDMSFRYVNQELKIDRQFNFIRKVEEPVDNFIKRISTNFGKVYMKKLKRKKAEESPNAGYKEDDFADKIFFLKNEQKIDGRTPCHDILKDPTELKLVILEEEFLIRRNVPNVRNMSLPSSILAGFPVYPSQFESVYVDKVSSSFIWYRSIDGSEWKQVGEGYLYVPSSTDIGCQLKLQCIPRNDCQTGSPVEAKSRNTVEAGPGECPFDIRHLFTTRKLSGKRITSYNILADTYADSDYSRETLFSHCAPYALVIDYRKQLVLKELIGFKSDIICLQEVDSKIYDCDLQPSLSTLNYSSDYSAKNEVREGLAIFFDNRRFEKINFEYSYIGRDTNLSRFHQVWMKIENEKFKERFVERNTAIQATTLRSIENPLEILVVGNTHLYFHPDADHIRLLQAYYVLTYIEQVARATRKKFPDCNVSICLCGDFNSTPECGVYQLITENYVQDNHKDWSSNPEESVNNVSLSHEFHFSSACGTPEYTNFTPEFSGCLDYIFYQKDRLKVEQVIPMPSKEELTAHNGLPSVVFPSDHISLCADLHWITD